MDAGDGWAQFVVLMVTALCGLVGMKVSFDGEQTASQDAISERVAKQVAAMETAETIPVIGVPLGDLKDRLAVSGLRLRWTPMDCFVSTVCSPQTPPKHSWPR